jgi:hypothetical protein
VWRHAFLISALEGGEWSASRPGRFTLGERVPGTHWIGGWVSPRAGIDAVAKREFSNPCREVLFSWQGVIHSAYQCIFMRERRIRFGGVRGTLLGNVQETLLKLHNVMAITVSSRGLLGCDAVCCCGSIRFRGPCSKPCDWSELCYYIYAVFPHLGHFTLKVEAQWPLKRWYPPATLHVFTTSTWNITAVRNSKLTSL